jgi:uncharacterized protein YdeI (YjbR/CyaY-like superfamily)
MNTLNPKVDTYLRNAKKWREELTKLRSILLSCGLTEELKWGKPCYMYEETNLVVVVGFKEYCGLILCKGALLKDPMKILVKAGENTQAARQARFASLKEIVEKESILKSYMHEAIEAEKAGLEVEFKAITKLVYCDELQKKLKANPALKTAFEALTPGRRRAYNMHFSAAKQSQTRDARIDKYTPDILNGKGMHDDYKAGR